MVDEQHSEREMRLLEEQNKIDKRIEAEVSR